MSILPAISFAALLALTASVVWVGWVVLHKIERAEPLDDRKKTFEQLSMLATAIDKNQARIDDLQLAVSDGIERVHRAEARIKKTVTNAKRLLADGGLEHPALDAEAEEISERDGEPSTQPELFEVPSVLEDDRPTGIPGLSRAEANRRFGLGA